MSSFLVNGINPYRTDIEFYYKYPPLFHYFITFFGILTNFSYAGPKLMILVFDILNIIMIYKIGIKIKDKVLGTNAALFYAFNPIIILQVYHDVNEFVTLFFTLLAVYFLISERLILSSASLALGIAFKLYPIFFLIPITIYIYKNSVDKGLKNVIVYYSSLILTFLLVCLPFLIISPGIFIERFFIHSSRMNLGDSIAEQIPELLILFEPAFEIFGITFSYQFIIQLCVVLFIFSLFFYSKEEFNIHDLFTVIVIISLILPLINYQIQLKYTNLISFPFLLFIVYKDMKDIKENEIYFLYLINFLSILLFIIVYIIIFPPIDNLLSYEALVDKGRFYVLFWLVCFLIFVLNDYRHHEEGDYKIFILIILPFITYNLFDSRLGVLITISIILLTILYVYNKYWLGYKKKEKIFII
jgi:hypothetical protein